MWIVAIDPPTGTRAYLAGDPNAAVSDGRSPWGQVIDHERKTVTHEGAGWPRKINVDLGNASTTISGTTWFTFASINAADIFAADLTGLLYSGTLVLLSRIAGQVYSKRTGANAVAMIKVMSQVGCAVQLGYTVKSGALEMAANETLVDIRVTADGDVRVTTDGDRRVRAG